MIRPRVNILFVAHAAVLCALTASWARADISIKHHIMGSSFVGENPAIDFMTDRRVIP